MAEVIGALRDYANANKKLTGASNKQGVPFAISPNTAFALGCRILCEKATVLVYLLYEDQNVKNETNQKFTNLAEI